MNSNQDPSSAPREPVGPDSAAGPAPAAGENSAGAPGIPAGNQGTRSGSDAGFFGWLRSLRIVRGQDRWIGGVAIGISARSGLDVVLVRGIFVVLALFGGIGLLAYGLAWALLPEPDGRIHAESAARGSWTSGMTGALIVSLLGLWRPNAPFFGDNGGFGGFIWSLFWIGVAVFVVYWITNASRNKTDGGANPTPLDSYSAGMAAAGAPPTSDPSGGSASGGTAPTDAFPPVTYPTRPYTGPVGPPVKPAPAIPRPAGSDVAIFLGGAVLLAALVLVLDYVGVLALGGSVISVALATGVVVLGLGIVLLGIRGRSSGALGFLAAVAIAATMLSSASPLTGNWVLADQGRWSTTATNPGTEGYTVVAGQGRVDLTSLANITEDVVIPVNTAAGNIGILVPETIPVDVRSRLALSSTEVVDPTDATSVGGLWQPGTLHLNEDATGPRIILDIRGVASHITIATTEDALQDTESGQ